MPAASTLEAKRFRTLVWIVSLCTVGLMFDGYDLVVYGTVVSTFLRDPAQIGPVDPALAGALGSYALLGVLVGALVAGSIGDFLGRRKMMLGAYAWFSLGMAATAFTHTATTFGVFRFVTGLGVGVLLATTAALVSEFAPKGRKNLGELNRSSQHLHSWRLSWRNGSARRNGQEELPCARLGVLVWRVGRSGVDSGC